MSLHLDHPQAEIDKIVGFLKATFQKQQKTTAVIAVSGGIDSALSLTLLTRALPKEQIHTLFLPYADQSIEDSQLICSHHGIPAENQHVVNIQPTVDTLAGTVSLVADEGVDHFRKGNLMARTRMIVVYDWAKKLDALVCGTENKSEHYLGYFTRFGDAASDIEPICHLYKTQVRQLVAHLQLPERFLEKPPSAGLWVGQTDEKEMGFSYEVADQVLEQLIDEGKSVDQIQVKDVDTATIQKVAEQVARMQFKLVVPYILEE